MPMLTSRIVSRFLLVGALTAAAVGCSDDDKADPAPATQQVPSAIFVGETTLAAETSIAVVVGAAAGAAPDQAAVYICDGVSTGNWFYGTAKAGALDVKAEDGATVTGTIESGRVVGKVTLAGQAAVDFTAPLATGVAGIYLVDQTATGGKGRSANGGELDATIAATKAVTGTIKPREGAQVALTGTAKTFGEAEAGAATWIVQTDGDVKGRVSKARTGTAGGGNCSAWSGIKSLMFGVDCSFF